MMVKIKCIFIVIFGKKRNFSLKYLKKYKGIEGNGRLLYRI